MTLIDQVQDAILRGRLLKRGQPVLVAVSGGLDSMVLLHLLHALAPARSCRWQLRIAHFNHQLRGRASDADQQLVRHTAEALGLRISVGCGDVRAFARRRGISVEMAARQMRHAFLARTARRLGVGTIALAHHADDQVEHFLLRLLRGAGAEGMAGMKPQSPSPALRDVRLIRPLLHIARADLESHARRNRIRFRQDASNASLDLQRNRIRHELLPLLRREYQPGLSRTVLRTMDILGAEADCVLAQARHWLDTKHRTAFDRLHLAVQRQVLRLQLAPLNLRPDFELVERLRRAVDEPATVSPGCAVIRDEKGLVHVRPRPPAGPLSRPIAVTIALDPAAGERLFDGVRCCWKVQTRRGKQPPGSVAGCEVFDADAIGAVIGLRHWRPGDRFQPIGMASPVKLQDLFTNRKVPREDRHQLLIAESASGIIFWVEGLRISEQFKLTSKTRRQLVWRWHRE
jgi:tRNA(Ile)-lysidine synthase